ncbi:putative alanine aminotransferase, partial [Gregarina niphandrodes]
MTRLNGHTEYYHLDEDNGWRCTVQAIDDAYCKARDKGKNVKAIVVIAPGNPAPTVLTEQDVLSILCYAQRRNLAVIADEVYQENVY